MKHSGVKDSPNKQKKNLLGILTIEILMYDSLPVAWVCIVCGTFIFVLSGDTCIYCKEKLKFIC